MLANERPKWSYYSSSHSTHYTSGRNTAKQRPWLFWEQQRSLLNVPHPSLQHASVFFFFHHLCLSARFNRLQLLFLPYVQMPKSLKWLGKHWVVEGFWRSAGLLASSHLLNLYLIPAEPASVARDAVKKVPWQLLTNTWYNERCLQNAYYVVDLNSGGGGHLRRWKMKKRKKKKENMTITRQPITYQQAF